MRVVFRAILIFLFLGAATATAGAPAGSIDDFIDAELPVSGAPGIAYAAVDKGAIISGERGEFLLGGGRMITPETPFRLGSISKSFTAMAVMQLAEAGDVDLDAGISHYLDVFEGSPAAGVTIRQLLSHTSGYSTRQGNDPHAEQGGDAGALARQVARIAQWTPAYAPDAKWDYSNANYIILGGLIETVSGEDYADYIKTHILAPIGMTHSFVADGAVHDEIAVGHRPWFGGKRAFLGQGTSRATAPAGGVIASARDVALYLAVMMNGEDDVLSAESKAAMLRPASDASPNYGFGWMVDAASGTARHTGVSPGTETLAVLVPAEGKGVVVLVNAGSGMGFGETANLLNGVSARALGIDEVRYGGQWSRQALFATFVLLPVLFVLGMIGAWGLRGGLRAKSGVSGAFSLWFPLVITLALAWCAVCLIPQLFGVSMTTLQLYSPDLAIALVATAATGVVWAVFRLGVYYSGR